MMRFNGVVCVEWQWGQSMNRWLGKNFSAQPGYQTGKRFPKFRRSVLTVGSVTDYYEITFSSPKLLS